MFEIKHKDACGRIGILDAKGKKLETPCVFPVVNPNLPEIEPKEIKKLGFDAVITNSYIISKSPALREKALKHGVKKLLDFDGIVMTDSGSYQLYGYGSVEVEPNEIVEFQEKIKSDIGVILDIPSPPDIKREEAERNVKETLKRAKEALKLEARKNMLLASTVQGASFLDLREHAARELAKLEFDVYAIGGVVPFLESYRFRELAEIIMHSKQYLPLNKPVHLFGAGHPMMLSLACALGCDFFDSASYSLYAKDGRYMTEHGTLHVTEMNYLPCSCPICSGYSLKEVKESYKLIALHNLYAIKGEISRIKQAISENSLWNLVEQRSRAHPKLLEALKAVLSREYEKNFEELEPATKNSAFFYFGEECMHRAEAVRHLERAKNLEPSAKSLVLLPYRQYYPSKIGSNRKYSVCYLSPIFGAIPSEVEEVYPLAQHIFSEPVEEHQKDMMRNAAYDYIKGKKFKKVFVHDALRELGIEGEEITSEMQKELERDDEIKLSGIGDYLFGKGSGKLVFKGCSAKYSKTKKMRWVYDEKGTLVATIRASDGIPIFALEGAKRLKKLEFPKSRVVIKDDKEIEELIKNGKNLFAKFIENCNPNIRAGNEVLVVNKKDELLGYGRAALGAREMLSFKRGVAVETRFGFKK